jgi:NitT/TauT family transport system permease protein
MKKGLSISSACLGLVMFLVLWQLLSWVIHRPIMPSPLTVLPVFFSSLIGELGLHLLASAGRVLAAIGIGVITAVPVGLGLGQVRTLDRIFFPLVAIAYPIPKIVLFPVIYVLLGITDFSKIFLIALIIFFQILVVVRDEAANLHPELILSVRSLGAGSCCIDGTANFSRDCNCGPLYRGTIPHDPWVGLLYCSGILSGTSLP